MSDHASKLTGLAWVAGACFMGALFALGLSPLAHAIPWSWEQKLGYAVETDILNEQCFNERAHDVLQQLVVRIYPLEPGDKDFSIRVQIVKSPVVNAYATLGGNIYINSGLLAQAESPEEIAGVLAHEIGHVQNRHIMEGALTHLFTAEAINAIFNTGSSAAQWANYFLKMDFTRRQETQADRAGLKRLQAAHADNTGFKHFFERMEESNTASTFLSDHPSNEERINMAEKFTNQDTKPILSAADWKTLKSYCGSR